MDNRLIFEKGSIGRKGYSLPANDIEERAIEDLIPERFRRKNRPGLPELSELDVVRHFTSLSQRNYAIDTTFYPLGSCTMKYNPKINEEIAGIPGFARIHPLQPEVISQGALRIMFDLETYLKEISGLERVSLQPSAGAQGELAGMLMIRAYHKKMGNPRKTVIIPDSAHGTNPASATLAGFDVREVKSDNEGLVDIEDLKKVLDKDCAALMLTNPNTLGLFEREIKTISKLVHEMGALLYMDGANLNALLGICRPGDMGFDLVHFNLHKTFSTPHGGGGPGSGPIGVKRHLAPFLPIPTIEKDGERLYLDFNRPESIGKLQAFYGNFAILVRAYSYIRIVGEEGLNDISINAVLNANYIRKRLELEFFIPFNRACMHEFVLSAKRLKAKGIHAWDLAKRLIDYGLHPPTVYFPLIVEEAMMIEPTETESKETLDQFCDAMIAIAREADRDPELIKKAPHTRDIGRLDEVRAARNLDVCFSPTNRLF